MKIYVNGDSNIAGAELETPNIDSVGNQLSVKLGGTVILNDAIAGSSNDGILRRTYEYLRNCGQYPDFMIIGWTSSEREDWFIDGEYKGLNMLDVNIDEAINTKNIDGNAGWDYWRRRKATNHPYHAQMIKYWNTKIFNFHLELKHLGIKHFFFNAIYNFNIYGGCDDDIFEHNWEGVFYKPYETGGAMVQWCVDSGFKEITPGWFHFPKPAHTAWANILYNHIKENNLL